MKHTKLYIAIAAAGISIAAMSQMSYAAFITTTPETKIVDGKEATTYSVVETDYDPFFSPLRAAATPATTETQMLTKYPTVTQATITAFKTAVMDEVKAGKCQTLSGYGDLGTGKTPVGFYPKVTTVSGSINFTTSTLTQLFDPTKTIIEWGTCPNYISAANTKWADNLATKMGAEYGNFATKLVPAVQAEWIANTSGVEFSAFGTFTYKVSATTGATSIGFTGTKLTFP